jgi:AcrR family transcriptional regulator
MTVTARVDGRAARGARARDAIVEAFLALVQEGHLRPTAARVAERAGLSLRSVFHHFADTEAVFAAAADRHTSRILALATPLPSTGPLAKRLDAFVAQRARLLEAIAPVRRAALLLEPFSAEVAARLAGARRFARDEVERAFGPELAARRGRDRTELRSALAAASGFPLWESLRRHEGLGVAAARRVMARTLRGLLEDR